MRTDRYKDNTDINNRNNNSDPGAQHLAADTKIRRRKKRRPLRILLIMILLLAAAIGGAVGYSYKTTADSLDVNFKEEPVSVEVGGEYSAMDYISDSVGEVEPSEEYLDADTVGAKEIVYTDTQPMYGGILNPTKEFTLSYTVVDSSDPVMFRSGDGTVLERGSELNINEVIAYGDNADPEPDLEVKGEVDMKTSGRYPLHVTVTDDSGNSIEWDLTVEVADSVPVYQDTSPRTEFKDFVSANAGQDRSFGIDVSAWQEEVDYEAAKKDGCEFVMIRIGYSVDGVINIDSYFRHNLEQTKAAGLKTGLYLYSYDNSEKEVRAAARQIIDELGGEALDLPVVFDWEDFGHFQTYKMSFTDLNRMYDAFADELAGGQAADAAGASDEDSAEAGAPESPVYDCMLYGSKLYLENIWEDTDTRPVWLAHYTDKTDYKGPYRMWQASCTGRISGISGDVDMDILYDNQ